MIAELNESNRPQFLAAVRGRPYFGDILPVHLAVFGRSGALMRFYVADGSAAVQLKGRSAVLCGTYDAEETGAFLRMQGVRYVNAGGAAPAGYSPLYALHNLVLANRIRQYIGTHFTEQLTLEDIGEALSMSPYHLAHIFKEITGMSPIHYMIRCRVGEAQNLLISTDYSATQIAAIVGYTNVNHFNAIFAKLVGLPPIRYRRKYLENMQGSRLQ